MTFESANVFLLTLCSERPKLYTILAFLSTIGFMPKKKNPLKCMPCLQFSFSVGGGGGGGGVRVVRVVT